MITKLTHASILVRDQEEALNYYTETLGFEKRTDQPMGEGARWVTVGPKNHPDMEIVLQPAGWGSAGTVAERAAQIGKGPGFVFATDDCRQTVAELKAKGVEFTTEPEAVPWGVQAVFTDLYGNTHVLVQPPTG